MPFQAAHAPTGPLGFHLADLEEYGLGLVVRVLRVPGAPVPEPLRRLYCLSCGKAVAREPLIAGWWICPRGCNGPTGDPVMPAASIAADGPVPATPGVGVGRERIAR